MLRTLTTISLCGALWACTPGTRSRSADPADTRTTDSNQTTESAGGLYDYREHVLENGLRVITLEDHSTPIAAVQLWYHVGSKDEQRDRRGFAHMFEHMMFRGTDNIGPEEHFDYIRRVGGDTNAYTSFDNTTYIQVVPAAQVEMVMWLEAERMAFLKIDENGFVTERKVVAEEFRVGNERPYGSLPDRVLEQIFTEHPYAWTPIGNQDELARATSDELQAFWNTYYVPNNATLVVVGDIRHVDVQGLADKYFGWIPRYPDPPRVTVEEPPVAKPRKIALKEKNGPAPVAGLLWRAPPTGHADELPMELLASILGQGDSSRVVRDLVNERELAMFAVAGYFPLEQDGLFGVGGVLPVLGGDRDKLLAAVRDQVAKLRSEGVTEAELFKAKNNALRSAVTELYSVASKARTLGAAAVIERDLPGVNRQLDDIRSITVADLQRVAKTYLAPEREIEITVEPSLLGFLGSRVSGKSGNSDDKAAAAGPTPPSTGSGKASGKPDLQRPGWMAKKPPIATQNSQFAPARITRKTLDNGLRVVLVPDSEVPFVTVRLGLDYGAYSDSDKTPGLASMTMAMLNQGTDKRSYEQLNEELDRYAIRLSGDAGMDRSAVYASALAEHGERAIELLAEVVREPSFPAERLQKQIKQLKTGLAIQERSAEYLAERQFLKRVYGSHPYARTVQGETADLDRLDVGEIRSWWEKHVRPDAAVLFVAGDIEPERTLSWAQTYLGGWSGTGEQPTYTMPALPKPAPTRIYLVDRPGDQAQIRVGHRSIKRDHPDYFTGRVMSGILGGGFNSRLNSRIRVKEGLTYGARGGIRPGRFAGIFEVSTFSKTATVGKTVSAILDELARMRAAPPSAEEHRDFTSYLLGSFPGRRETAENVVRDLWIIESEELPTDHFQRYLAAVAATTPASVHQSARNLLDGKSLTIVVVGPADQLQPQLMTIAPVEVVKP